VKTSSLDLSRPELELDINVPIAMGNDHFEGLLPARFPQLDPSDALVLVFELRGYKLPGTITSEHSAGFGLIDGLRPPVAWSLPAELH